MNTQLYEYAVILNAKTDRDGNEIEPAELVVQPTYILAKNETQATLLAGRAVPEDYMDRMDRLTVAVRPF